MSDKNRATLGKIATDLASKQQNIVSVVDQTDANLSDYGRYLEAELFRWKGNYPHTDFYLVVITKREKLFSNVLRNYFFCRNSCPTPDYDQVVFRYTHKDDLLWLLWVIPNSEACRYLIRNKSYVSSEEYRLLSYILDFRSGELFKTAKRLNGEKDDSPLIVK